MISQTAEYALRAVVCLAEHPERAFTARELAEAADLPKDYASKVLEGLSRAGIVHGRRGRGGGYRLSRRPSAIPLLDVLSAVDPIRRIRACPLGRVAHVSLCPLHRRLDDLAAKMEQELAGTTVAKLVEGGRRPLCAE